MDMNIKLKWVYVGFAIIIYAIDMNIKLKWVNVGFAIIMCHGYEYQTKPHLMFILFET